jgi:MYXO-CTERM domain-containing protein
MRTRHLAAAVLSLLLPGAASAIGITLGSTVLQVYSNYSVQIHPTSLPVDTSHESVAVGVDPLTGRAAASYDFRNAPSAAAFDLDFELEIGPGPGGRLPSLSSLVNMSFTLSEPVTYAIGGGATVSMGGPSVGSPSNPDYFIQDTNLYSSPAAGFAFDETDLVYASSATTIGALDGFCPPLVSCSAETLTGSTVGVLLPGHHDIWSVFQLNASAPASAEGSWSLRLFSVPEPGAGLLAASVLALIGARRRRATAIRSLAAVLLCLLPSGLARGASILVTPSSNWGVSTNAVFPSSPDSQSFVGSLPYSGSASSSVAQASSTASVDAALSASGDRLRILATGSGSASAVGGPFTSASATFDSSGNISFEILEAGYYRIVADLGFVAGPSTVSRLARVTLRGPDTSDIFLLLDVQYGVGPDSLSYDEVFYLPGSSSWALQILNSGQVSASQPSLLSDSGSVTTFFSIARVPEPGLGLLAACALGVLLAWRRRC